MRARIALLLCLVLAVGVHADVETTAIPVTAGSGAAGSVSPGTTTTTGCQNLVLYGDNSSLLNCEAALGYVASTDTLSATSVIVGTSLITPNFGITLAQNPASVTTNDHQIKRAGTGLGLYVGTGASQNTRISFLGGSTALASATALPVPTGRVHHVSGTTTITSITSTNLGNGVCITLIFDGILTVTNGGNLNLAGDFVTSADDTLSLCYDGAAFFETSRSVN